jgi:hypothetical protein
MKSKSLTTAITLSVVFLLLTGCASPRGWSYSAAPPVERPPLVQKSLAVPPLTDQRSHENENKAFMSFIPFVPYGWIDYNTPETVQMHLTTGLWQFKPTEDIAKAFALEVQNRRLFKEAFFTFRESEGDYILRGSISSTKLEGKIYSYCLSFIGIDLQFLGLPAGSLRNDLTLEVSLEDRASQKKLWSKRYMKEHEEGPYWIYGLPSDFWYDDMLKEAMPGILSDMEQALKDPGGL